MPNRNFLWLIALLLLSACGTARLPHLENVQFTILQLNDVYEIAPLEGGKSGGLARVATVKQELLRENPNTIAVLAGDFLSPSFIGTLKLDNGDPIAGLQMVETLNAMGLDYATFGNHEFDLKDAALLKKRIDQSRFQYTCSNILLVKDGIEQPFTQNINGVEQPVPPYIIHEFAGPRGQKLRVAIVGVVLPFNQQPYVKYLPVEETFRKMVRELEDKADVILGLTHLAVDEDLALAATTPQVPLFMGGHDHSNMGHYVEQTVVAKADANAKTVYIHRFTYNPATRMTRLRSSLKPINDQIADEPATLAVVNKWEGVVSERAAKMGYDIKEVVMTATEPLECTETVIRSNQTNYGQLTLEAFRTALPASDVYLINSGSMRLDDRLMGDVTVLDVLRTFPYGGNIVRMQLPGAVLEQALRTSLVTNRGEGGYFQVLGAGAEPDAQGRWTVQGRPIESQRMYSVVLPQFVADGKEANLSFLGQYAYETPAALKNGLRNDIRDIVIAYMKTF